MKKFLSFIFVVCLTFVIIGCGGGTDDVKPTKLNISAANTTLLVGETVTLKVEFEPSDTTNKNVSWASSDTNVASVSSAGVVKGNAAGQVKIIATSKADESIKGEITLEVKEGQEIVPTAISVWGEDSIVIVGYTTSLFVTYTPAETTSKFVSWESSDESVATVNEDGIVTGIKAGTATITAKSLSAENVSGTMEITVKDAIDITDLAISFEGDMVIGYDFTITATTTPEGGNKQLEWSSSDETVATVNANGVVSALKVGTAVITVKVMNKAIEQQITVNVVNPPALEDFTITNARKIATNETCTLGIATTPKYAENSIKWSVDDESIATIDEETGKLTPVQVGKVVVTAVDQKTNISKTVEIVIEAAFDPNAKPTSITVTGEGECFVGYSIQLTAQVFPAGVSQKVTWAVNDTEVATIDENGKLTALKPGNVRVKAISVVDTSISSTNFRVTIEEEPKEPEKPNLGGYEIIIMNADSALAEIDPFLDGYAGVDKEYKQRAWNEVQNDFNCKIKVEAYPATAPWGPQRISWINDNAMANTSKLDFGIVSAAWLYQFVQANSVVDTTTFFKKYGKKQIEASQRDAGSYQNKLYIVSTGLSETRTYPYKGLFYNYGMLQELGLESPAKLFNEDKWSYDDFVNYCISAQALMPEGKYVMSGGPSIAWSGMVNAGGVKIADKATLELNLTHTYSLEAIAALTKVVEAGAWAIDDIGYDQDNAPFQNGDALFQPAEYWFVKSDNRFPANLWGENTQYGYVPFPYPKTVGKENTMVNDLGGSVYLMISGRNYPAGVTPEGVYYAVQTMFLDTIKYQKADEAFDPVALKYNTVKSRIDDPESIDATIYFTASMTLYDPLFEESFQYEWGGETTTAIINSVKGADPREQLDAIFSTVDLKFKNIYAQ